MDGAPRQTAAMTAVILQISKNPLFGNCQRTERMGNEHHFAGFRHENDCVDVFLVFPGAFTPDQLGQLDFILRPIRVEYDQIPLKVSNHQKVEVRWRRDRGSAFESFL
jgi:hypothetical protein